MFTNDIPGVINKKIDEIVGYGTKKESGTVISIADGVARIYGLKDVYSGEVVEFENGEKGIVINLNESEVSAVLISDFANVREGQEVKRTKGLCGVPVGEGLLGRVVNPLGEPLDGKGPIVAKENYPVERPAPGIIERKSVSEPLQTGVKMVDLLIPIGKGQRELIIGDRGVGKSSIVLDTIINQRQYHDSNIDSDKVYCVYVAIGQKMSFVTRFIKMLEEKNALEYSVVVVATSSDSATLQFLAPYAGCSIAEYFRDNGKHAMVAYDDLTKHAVAYREMTLLLKRPPGREAYPGDVFYIHSRLLERAAKMSKSEGNGSLTALPIVETQDGDISAYIPTNVISITDGQIFMDKNLFNSGIRPAIDVGLSVSRVGSAAQKKIIKKIAGSLKLDISNYLELKSFSKFASDLDADSKRILNRGDRIVEVLKQSLGKPQSVERQFLTMYLCTKGHLDNVDLQSLYSKLESFLSEQSDLLTYIKTSASVTEELESKIEYAVKNSVIFS